MAEKTGAAGASPEAPDIRRKLVWRMGVAGAMIALLLAALALFDRLNAPDDDEDTAPTYTAPVPTAKQEVSQPVTTAPASTEKPAEEAATPAKPAEPEVSAAPVTPKTAAAAAAEAPPRPQVAAQPALPAAAHNAPATRSAPAPAGKVAASAPAAAAPAAVPAAAAPANNAAARTPPASSAEAAPPSLPAPLVPRLLNGYALQAGVFADTHRAEELHALLTLNGIPSTIETRVQAGPFRNRAEAAAAREKMKSLGIDSVLLPPKRNARP